MSRIKHWIKSKRFWKRFSLFFIGIPTLLFFSMVLILYTKQDAIVQDLIVDYNKNFDSVTEIKDSHISLFKNFPYISIDLEDLKMYESKKKSNTPIINIKDAYIGFNLWTILTGKMEIKKIKLKDGKVNIIQHKSGDFNILNALTSKLKAEESKEEFHLNLKKIELENIDLTKLNEANNLKVDAFIEDAHSKFKTSGNNVTASLDTRFILNIISNGDTTFLKHKHIDFDTKIVFEKGKDILKIQPTKVHLEQSEFNMKGSIDFLKDMFLDLDFTGNKKNFNLFIALAPEEIMKRMQEFENAGDIYLKTTIKGRSLNGHNPLIKASFGCSNGHFTNLKTGKSLNGLNFKAFFTNGKKRNKSTMQFMLHKLTMKPEKGEFKADIEVSDFTAPAIDLRFKTKFQMDFVSKFLEFEHLKNLKGNADIALEFKDIIDLKNPEHAISRLKETYKMNISLKEIDFETDLYHLPIKDLNFTTEMKGHTAEIKELKFKIGKSDLNISGKLDDLPAIIHHTNKQVDTRLKIKSRYIDLFELTGSDTSSINEQITNLNLDLDFKTSAKAMTESKYLPVGEFFIENLNAKLKHYPHTFHDFHADVIIDEQDLRVVDFRGMIDKSDFAFSGKMEHYEKWLTTNPNGKSKLEFNLVSKMLQLESLFTYKGDNFVPEEYRHEEFDNLNIHGISTFTFNNDGTSFDLQLDKFDAKMKIHPLRFEKFNGRIHYEKDHIVIEDFSGKLGHSIFNTTLHYYTGNNEKLKKRENHFSIKASRLDIDELIKYNPAPAIKKVNNSVEKIDHDAGFNIYELPFTHMTYHLDINQLNYNKHLLNNIKGDLRTTPNHYIHIDHLKMDAAGGHFDISGYFNGSNPKLIYFSPNIHAKNVDLDKLLVKFDNFGQDHLVSENLHGKFTGRITGKIHMHNDLVPKIDDSEIHMDLDVTHGRLENYSLLFYMSDYFKDKNLNKVLFDTLNNHIDINKGQVTIPKMTINSSLGHMEISGKQDLAGNMEYYLSIPWKMVSKTAATKLFGKSKTDEELASQVDEIQYQGKNTKYVNITIVGNEKGYKFSLGKDKNK